MLIILTAYVALVWLVFSRFVEPGWISGGIALLGGVSILAVFLAMFNSLTPSGSFVVTSRVIEVTPNVSGQVVAIPVKPDEPVSRGAVLFRIDPDPFQFKVNQLEAALSQAQQQVQQLKASYEQTSATVEGLAKQLAFHSQRMTDIEKLTREEALSVFRTQDTQVQYETVYAQLEAAKASQERARIAMNSEIGGVNTTVAQVTAQLDHARWELDQTTVVAPGEGYVTLVTLGVGDRVVPARSVMSFVVSTEIMIVGMFPLNGFNAIKPGAAVKLVFENDPGRIHRARIASIPEGVGQGQVAVSGVLAKVGSIGGAKAYPALISIPPEIDRGKLRLGVPGTATVFADHAGAIGLLMSILVWVSSYTAYL